MRKKLFAAVLMCTAVLICACGNKLDFPDAPSATPTTVPIESIIAAYADAEVTEEDGQLIIGIRVAEADAAAACVQFFNQSEEIYAACISGSDYTGVSFSLLRDELVVASFFVLPSEGGMQVFEPVVFDEAYADAVIDAFYASAFATSLQD